MNPLSLLTPIAYAATCPAGQYSPIAPFGTISGCLNLTQYLNQVFTTTIGIAGILAVVIIVVCAVRMMTTGSVAGRSEAKECIYNAIFGVLIAIGSWLLLNTINPQLLKNDAVLAIQAPTQAPAAGISAATTQTQPAGSGCYFRFRQISTGNVKYAGAGTGEMCEIIRHDYEADADTEVQTACACNSAGAPAPLTPTTAPPVSTVTGSVSCPLSGRNLCEPQFRQCTNSHCAQFTSMASNNASHTGLGGNGAAFIKAIIMGESSCGTQLVGDGGESCGPMHIKPSTANRFLNQCGLTQPVTCGWLTTPANFDKAICLSAEFIQSLSSTGCGSDIRNLAAGYNGGAGACANSVSCAGDTSCDGSAVKKWECLYDNTAHNECNGGYNTTRNYATKALYCTNNPGY